MAGVSGVGIVFIGEGRTECVFYEQYVIDACSRRGLAVEVAVIEGERVLTIGGKRNVLILFHDTGSVSAMPRASLWFRRACWETYPQLIWQVFLCYDTDGYNQPITRFYKDDWSVLREELDAMGGRVTDLAASADIEDIMLCDIAGVCAYLGLPDDSVPSGRNGKTKMKSLFRARDSRRPYHEADKALPLIQALDMRVIRDRAPIPLAAIDEALFGDEPLESGEKSLM